MSSSYRLTISIHDTEKGKPKNVKKNIPAPAYCCVTL